MDYISRRQRSKERAYLITRLYHEREKDTQKKISHSIQIPTAATPSIVNSAPHAIAWQEMPLQPNPPHDQIWRERPRSAPHNRLRALPSHTRNLPTTTAIKCGWKALVVEFTPRHQQWMEFPALPNLRRTAESAPHRRIRAPLLCMAGNAPTAESAHGGIRAATESVV